jgi:hypothetical protein
MTLRESHGYHDCSACGETHVGGYTLTMGDLTWSLCDRCIRLLARLLRREERRAAKA